MAANNQRFRIGPLLGVSMSAGAIAILTTIPTASRVVGVANAQDRGETTKTMPTTTAKPATPCQSPALLSLPLSVREAPLTGIDGVSFKLADYSGKVLLVNLWATWCGPCRFETPELVRLYKRFKSQGVEIVGLTTEDPELSAELVRNWVRNFKVDYRISWATEEVAAALLQGRNSHPQTFVISRDGRIVKRFVGFSATQTPRVMRQAIEEALNCEPESADDNPE